MKTHGMKFFSPIKISFLYMTSINENKYIISKSHKSQARNIIGNKVDVDKLNTKDSKISQKRKRKRKKRKFQGYLLKETQKQ
jgi:hypothetical protein